MNRLDIERCNDIEKLKKLALEYRSQLFYISETLVDESKRHISSSDAIKDIRNYLVNNQYKIDKIGVSDGN